jgi:undecaprenyl diphosphate synthase
MQTLSTDVNFDFTKLDMSTFEKYLDTKHLPHPSPDLIIRTGGAVRMSGFMSWQSQYSELMFIEKFLPDFTPDDFTQCIAEYQNRQRRFGK